MIEEERILNYKVVRPENDSLLSALVKEISDRQAWKSELNDATTDSGKIIAVGNVCKKALYTAVGDDGCLFVPVLNNHICIDKIPTEEQDTPFTLSDEKGVYATGIVGGFKYVFSHYTVENETLSKKDAAKYSFMGYCAEYINFDNLRASIKKQDHDKAPTVSKEMLDFFDSFDKSAVRMYVKALADSETTESEKFEIRNIIAGKIIDAAKDKGIIERKGKPLEVAVYNLVCLKY